MFRALVCVLVSVRVVRFHRREHGSVERARINGIDTCLCRLPGLVASHAGGVLGRARMHTPPLFVPVRSSASFETVLRGIGLPFFWIRRGVPCNLLCLARLDPKLVTVFCCPYGYLEKPGEKRWKEKEKAEKGQGCHLFCMLRVVSVRSTHTCLSFGSCSAGPRGHSLACGTGWLWVNFWWPDLTRNRCLMRARV